MKNMIIAVFSSIFAFVAQPTFSKTLSLDTLPQPASFDVQKYMGLWYEVVRLPHRFEKGLIRVTAEYSIKKDGTIKVVNTGYDEEDLKNGKSDADAQSRAKGKARFAKSGRTGHLEVSFFGPFYGDYIIIALDEKNYQYAMVSGGTTDYLWILSRTPVMDEKILNSLIAQAGKLGYDTGKIIRVQQK